MRTVLISMTLPFALALAACESGDTTILSNEDGETVEVTRGGAEGAASTTTTLRGPDGEEVVQQTGADVPPELPDGFSVYPDAKVVSNQVTRNGAITNSMLMLQSDAAPADIAAYYKDQAEKAGLDIDVDLDMDTTHTVAGSRASDGVKMTVSARRDEGASESVVMLSVLQGPGG